MPLEKYILFSVIRRYRPARFCVCKTQRESKREREKGELREREEKSGETEKEEGREWKETE